MGPVMTISPLSGTAVRPRLPWVETARLLATLVVVMQHVPSGPFLPNEWLIGPALATFFLLAGYFSASRLEGRGAGKWTGGRLLSLLWPYLFWCAAYWLVAGMSLSPGSLASVFGAGTCPLLTPMWFLRDLMIFTLAAFLLHRWRPALYALGLFCLFLHRWDDTLAWPSPYMFGDFGSHIFVLIALTGVETCFPSPWAPWVWWCLVPVVYMLARGVYLFLKRYFPRALVLMTGGK